MLQTALCDAYEMLYKKEPNGLMIQDLNSSLYCIAEIQPNCANDFIDIQRC
jgi:hypothetical protein